MKLTGWFTRSNPVLSRFRIASAGALVLAALGMAFVAAKTSSPSSAPRPRAFVFKKGDPDAMRPGNNKRAVFAGGNEFRFADYTPDVEAYLKRAYPANEISWGDTINAQKGWAKLNSSEHSSGSWQLIGPSTANFPAVLTFSGAPYTTSGRITGLALAPNCSTNNCRLWVAAAGGGIWRSTNARATTPTWTFVSDSFATNAIGTLVMDPNDASGNTLYAGTGEPNVSVDSEAGMGIYKTTNGGNTWTHLASMVTNLTTPGNGTYTGDAFAARSVSGILVHPTNPNIIYVASARGVRGYSSVPGGATTTPPAPRPPFGLFKSTDGGATFTFIWDGNGTNRGVIDIDLDPSNPKIVYASALNQGTWRSMNGGTSFSLIKARLSASDPDRPEMAVTKLPNGKTRMYLGEGVAGSPQARFFRTDDATAAAPVFTDLTTSQNINYCTGQCWYDNVVYSPPGKPDVVYLGGSYDYSHYGFRNNGRGFLYSIDAGNSFTDVTWDATTTPNSPPNCCNPNSIAPNGMHPDQHAIVQIPGADAAFFGSDGGLMRSSGSFADISSQCTSRGLTGVDLTLCQQLLSRVPTQLYSLNKGLSTLQFQSLSVAAPGPNNDFHFKGSDDGGPQTKIQGGTQDNGTFQFTGSTNVWPQEIYGDGGQSGFSSTNDALRVNTFTGQFNDVNFRDGDPTKWVVATGAIVSSPEASYFYPPVTADPHTANGGTIFQGSFSVWRTQDWGGNQAFLEANCPEFTTSAANPACGDFVPIGPAGATDLTDTLNFPNPGVYGNDRRGGAVAWIQRTPRNAGTLWVATGTGRVFISDNSNTAASSVVWTRIDNTAANSPQRFPTGIYVDPKNPHHAWISYSGYIGTAPATTGHVFEVTWNGTAATWTDISYNLPNLPVTGLVRDDVRKDLYAASDFGVMRLPKESTTWTVAGTGLPMVEVPGLTIVPEGRVLYAATHGRSAWMLRLPEED